MSKQRPIAFLSSHHGTGACETLWLETAARMAQGGRPVCGMVCWKKHDHNRAAPLLDAGGAFRFLQPSLGTYMGKVMNRFLPYGRLAFSRFQRELRTFRPSLVTISQGNDISALPWMEATAQAGLPYTLVTHGVVPSEWADDDVNDRLRTALLAAKKTFWVSHRNREDIEWQIGCHLPNAQMIWNPLRWDRNLILPWPDAAAPKLRLACVSRLQVRSKGHDLLLRALATQEWSNRDWLLTFYGEGENRRALEGLANFLGISSKVRFAGHIADLIPIWQDCHWLAQPSRHEGMPMSLIEALLAGRPALVTDVAGHSEVIRDGENGIVAAAPTVMELQKALERVWQRQAEWPAMGQSAAQRIREQMPADPVGAYFDAIQSLVPQSAQP
jgi:glycosyltransferase involved in cell wall biosynthesis